MFSPQGAYFCEACNQSYANQYTLKRHMLTDKHQRNAAKVSEVKSANSEEEVELANSEEKAESANSEEEEFFMPLRIGVLNNDGSNPKSEAQQGAVNLGREGLLKQVYDDYLGSDLLTVTELNMTHGNEFASALGWNNKIERLGSPADCLMLAWSDKYKVLNRHLKVDSKRHLGIVLIRERSSGHTDGKYEHLLYIGVHFPHKQGKKLAYQNFNNVVEEFSGQVDVVISTGDFNMDFSQIADTVNMTPIVKEKTTASKNGKRFGSDNVAMGEARLVKAFASTVVRKVDYYTHYPVSVWGK